MQEYFKKNLPMIGRSLDKKESTDYIWELYKKYRNKKMDALFSHLISTKIGSASSNIKNNN